MIDWRSHAHPKALSTKPGVGEAAKQVAEHASTLAKLELELAGLELKQKAGALGAGVGLGIGAGAARALRARLPASPTAAVALALVLDAWLALLDRRARPVRPGVILGADRAVAASPRARRPCPSRRSERRS